MRQAMDLLAASHGRVIRHCFARRAPDPRSNMYRRVRGMDGQLVASAHEGGVLQIANHSWDHTHSSLDVVAQRDQIKGTFMDIDTWDDADRQIRQAEDYIEGILGRPSTRLFAVPYGCSVEYLHREYLPDFVSQHRQRACFETGGEYVTLKSNRWRLPRFTFGEHWKAPEGLARILAGAVSATA